MTRQSRSRSGARDSQISISHLDHVGGNEVMRERRASLMAIKQILMTDRKRKSEIQPNDLSLIEAETHKRIIEFTIFII